ncbi:dynamin family protein [Profundibacter sp.]|uniref:dynamin family protein n=1 Tax=Profundibacter sp. TaxID=3101071 RepID=UPI003D0F494E
MKHSEIEQKQLSFLQDFINKTDPDLGSIPKEAGPLRQLARKLFNRLRTPVRFIVAGEFSAGKSTLTNMLVGKNLIPTSVLASELPPLLFRYGATTQIAAGWWDQKKLIPVKGVDFDAAVKMDPDFILVTTPNPFLKDINIFDSPGTSDPLSDDSKMQHLVKSSEATIWCTNAVQAWRESERYTWSSLPAINRKNSILAVTHTDLPAVKRGIDRVMARVQKEAGEFFKTIVPVAAPKASRAAPDGVIQDKEAWAEYGGEAIFTAIREIAEPIREKKLADATAIIESQLVPFFEGLKHRDSADGAEGNSKAAPVVSSKGKEMSGVEHTPVSASKMSKQPLELKAVDAKAQTEVPEPPLLAEWNSKTRDLIATIEKSDDPDVSKLIQSSCDIVMEMTDTLTLIDPQTPEIEWVTTQFQEALDQLFLMQLETGEEPLETTTLLLLQLSRDMEQATTRANISRVS